MKQTNELIEIEKNFDVGSARIGELSAWPLVRHTFYFNILRKKVGFSSKLRSIGKIQVVKNAFYGVSNLLRISSFDYLFFNNADKRNLRVLDKKYDVFFDAWADKLGQDRSLFVEWALEKHWNTKEVYSKHVISDLIFKLGCVLFGLGVKKQVKGTSGLEMVKEKFGLEIDIQKELRSMYGRILFYRFLFRLIRPKIIFLISSFTKMDILVAAHLENIKVYEAQHGYIGSNHQFYVSYIDFGAIYYPDYLLAFGNWEKRNLVDYFIFKSDQIIPIGSLFLEHVKLNCSNANLEALRKKYDKVFCVTLQTVEESKLLCFVRKEAEKNGHWLFILKPRNYNHLDYSEFTGLENIVLFPEYNIYEILKYSDYNITMYSTTAVEAEIFGVKTLFYNLGGLSEKYFDVANMAASIIDVSMGLTEKALKEPGDFEPYFVLDYYFNVKNTHLS